MRKKQFLCIAMSVLLASTSQPVWAANTSDTSETSEAREDSSSDEFEWDDEHTENAIFAWQANDWSKYQEKLTLSGYIEASAHANVSDLVRGLETTVKNTLDSEDTLMVYANYSKTKYTEIVLAMIEVLAEDAGLITGDEDCSQSEFDAWTKDMGKYVNASYTAEWTTEESIRQIFYQFTHSANLYATYNNVKQPSPLSADDGLWISVEGTVMHGAVESSFYSSLMRDRYSANTAEQWYNSHKEAIDSYFSRTDLGDDYSPNESFASAVKSIYSVSEGYGNGAEYAADAPNETVSAVLAWLNTKSGCAYSQDAGKRIGPNSYDCSGLVYCALKACGVNAPNITTGDYPSSSFYKEISKNQLKVGDILQRSPGECGKNTGHVAFFLGYTSDGKIKTFEAKSTADGVGYFTRDDFSKFTRFYRWW